MSSKKINVRTQKWRQMVKQGIHNDKQLLKSRIRKGIPPPFRAVAWPQIINLKAFVAKHKDLPPFEKLINSPSKSTYEINLDVPRTFPQEEDTQYLSKSLNNVLKALSIACPRVGYCQGMNFLVMRLLQIVDDQTAFWIVYYLFENDEIIMRNFIDPTMIEEQNFIFRSLMEQFVPDIQRRFAKQNLVIVIFSVKWFITIFSAVLKQELFYRVFEIFLSQGWPALYGIGLGFLRGNEQKILQNNLQQNIKMMNEQIYKIKDIDQFMQLVFEIEIQKSLIEQLRKQYRMKQKKDEQIRPLRQSIQKGQLLPRPQIEDKMLFHFQKSNQKVRFQSFIWFQEAIKK